MSRRQHFNRERCAFYVNPYKFLSMLMPPNNMQIFVCFARAHKHLSFDSYSHHKALAYHLLSYGTLREQFGVMGRQSLFLSCLVFTHSWNPNKDDLTFEIPLLVYTHIKSPCICRPNSHRSTPVGPVPPMNCRFDILNLKRCIHIQRLKT